MLSLLLENHKKKIPRYSAPVRPGKIVSWQLKIYYSSYISDIKGLLKKFL
jgi:hypothetical protein